MIGAGAVGRRVRVRLRDVRRARSRCVEMASQMLPGADPEMAAGAPARVPPQGHRRAARHALRGAEGRRNGVRVAVSRREGRRGARGRPGAGRDRPPRRSRRTSASKPRGVARRREGLRQGGRAPAHQRARACCAIGDLVGGAAARAQGVGGGHRGGRVPGRARARRRSTTSTIPACIYAQPQVAWIGLTEAQARAATATTCASGASRSRRPARRVAAAHTAGFAKIVAEPRYGADRRRARGRPRRDRADRRDRRSR